MTSCPSCGAPVDLTRHSCEYRGTPYNGTPDVFTVHLYADGKIIDTIIEAGGEVYHHPRGPIV